MNATKHRDSTTPRLDAAWKTARKHADEAFEAHDALAMLEAETEAELIDLKRTLARKAGRLAIQMQALADHLDVYDDLTINPLGVVQSDGMDIDRTCCEIGRLKEVLRGIASAKRAAAEKGGAS